MYLNSFSGKFVGNSDLIGLEDWGMKIDWDIALSRPRFEELADGVLFDWGHYLRVCKERFHCEMTLECSVAIPDHPMTGMKVKVDDEEYVISRVDRTWHGHWHEVAVLQGKDGEERRKNLIGEKVGSREMSTLWFLLFGSVRSEEYDCGCNY